jgi:hypothetical protein
MAIAFPDFLYNYGHSSQMNPKIGESKTHLVVCLGIKSCSPEELLIVSTHKATLHIPENAGASPSWQIAEVATINKDPMLKVE